MVSMKVHGNKKNNDKGKKILEKAAERWVELCITNVQHKKSTNNRNKHKEKKYDYSEK